MREIKFRVWAGKEFYFATLEQLMTGDFYLCSEYPKQQFTDLKDKNGIEIYEGDIVKQLIKQLKICSEDMEIQGTVMFGEYLDDEGYTTFNHSGWHVTFTETVNSYTHSLMDLDVEVVGNIYENPELLENKL